jgi:hypothetical protein
LQLLNEQQIDCFLTDDLFHEGILL